MILPSEIAIVAVGGACGAALRFLFGRLSEDLLASPLFPFATLFINILGCFLIGIALALGYISISVIGGCAATYVDINLIAPRT